MYPAVFPLPTLALLLPLSNYRSALKSKRSFSFSLPTLQSHSSVSSYGLSSSREFLMPELLESHGDLGFPTESLDGSEGFTLQFGDGASIGPFMKQEAFLSGDLCLREFALHQNPVRPAQAYTLSNDGFMTNQQRIIITNNLGEKLVGILHDTGSRELVILCHGFRSSKESSTVMKLVDTLTREGISVFRFDFSGNGESEGIFQYGNYRKEVSDLRAVIVACWGLKHEISVIVGHSKGGNVVLLYASVYNDIHTIINISGRFDLEKGTEDRLGKDFVQRIKKDGFIDVGDKNGRFLYRVTEESLMDRLSTNMRAASLLIDCRVLTVHGSADEIVPVKDAFEFAKHISNHRLHIIEGADHRYSMHHAELASILLEFVSCNL